MESWFHVSPDGGSGTFEALLFAAIVVLLASWAWNRNRRKQPRS